MKKYFKYFLRGLNLLLWIGFGLFVVSPAGSWIPRVPNWMDFWISCLIGFLAAWVDTKIVGNDNDKGPKYPKNGKYA